MWDNTDLLQQVKNFEVMLLDSDKEAKDAITALKLSEQEKDELN